MLPMAKATFRFIRRIRLLFYVAIFAMIFRGCSSADTVPTAIATSPATTATQTSTPVRTPRPPATFAFETPSPTPAPASTPTSVPTVQLTPTPTASTSVREIQITGVPFSFQPASIQIKTGERVKLTFDSPGHTFTISELNIDLRQSLPEIERTFNQTGTFTYFCAVAGHRSSGMEGTLAVAP